MAPDPISSTDNQVALFFNGGQNQDDFMQAIDKFAKLVGAVGKLLPYMGGGNFLTASTMMGNVFAVRRVVWITFAARDLSLAVRGDLLKKDETVMNSVRIIKTSFATCFSLASISKFANLVYPMEQLENFSSKMGGTLPYFIFGMTGTLTVDSAVRGASGEWSEDTTRESLSVVETFCDWSSITLNTWVSPMVSADVANILGFVAASATLTAASMKLTKLARKHVTTTDESKG